ncbi:MAG: hypothetical protein FWF97_01140 [Alphaproteobacteria bacterium]|nr:hypothetical protein [Alphaproteobacteria bacterium]
MCFNKKSGRAGSGSKLIDTDLSNRSNADNQTVPGYKQELSKLLATYSIALDKRISKAHKINTDLMYYKNLSPERIAKAARAYFWTARAAYNLHNRFYIIGLCDNPEVQKLITPDIYDEIAIMQASAKELDALANNFYAGTHTKSHQRKAMKYAMGISYVANSSATIFADIRNARDNAMELFNQNCKGSEIPKESEKGFLDYIVENRNLIFQHLCLHEFGPMVY